MAALSSQTINACFAVAFCYRRIEVDHMKHAMKKTPTERRQEAIKSNLEQEFAYESGSDSDVGCNSSRKGKVDHEVEVQCS
jgi:hypothetical protein